MAVNCNLQTLLSNSRCFLDQCNSEAEREAIQIFLKTRALGSGGGTAYGSLLSLLTAAKTWQGLSEKQLSAISVYISLENAIENGSPVSSNINTLKQDAKCFMCLPSMLRKQLLKFLDCALGEQNIAG